MKNNIVLIVKVLLVVLFILMLDGKCIKASVNKQQKVATNTEDKKNDKEELYEYALSFGKFISGEEGIYIINTYEIYDKEGVDGYCFGFEYDDKSYGYAIYDIDKSDITVFSIEEGELGLYDKIVDNVDYEFEQTNILYKNETLDYFAVVICQEKTMGINVNGEIITEDKLASLCSSGVSTYSYDDIFDISGDIPDNIGYTHYLKYENYLQMPARYGEEYITKTLKCQYSCAVTAMLNVCANNKFFSVTSESARKKTYENLFILSQTKLNTSTGEYVTDKTKMGYSVAMLAKMNKGVVVSYTRKEKPSLSFFTSAINKGYSSVLGISTSCRNGSKIGVAGHAYSVIGYKNFAPCNSGGTSKVYLKVATGWGNLGDTEYILYNSINVISKYGIVWEYKPK